MARLRWVVKRSWMIVQYEGAPALLWRLLIRVGAPIALLGASRIYQRSLDGVLPGPAAAGLAVGPIQPADMEAVVALMAVRGGRGLRQDPARVAQSRALLGERLAAGQECFVARRGRQIVHCSWIAYGWIEWPGEHWTELPSDPRRVVLLCRDEAFHSDAYTHEAWRGRRIYPAALRAVLQHLKDRGIRRVYAEVGVDNRSSSKTYDRLDWQCLGSVLYFRAAGMRRVWRWVLGDEDPFVPQPDGYLRFRSVDKRADRRVAGGVA